MNFQFPVSELDNYDIISKRWQILKLISDKARVICHALGLHTTLKWLSEYHEPNDTIQRLLEQALETLRRQIKEKSDSYHAHIESGCIMVEAYVISEEDCVNVGIYFSL